MSLRTDVSVFGHLVFKIVIACFISYSLVCLSVFPNWRKMFKSPTESSD